MERPANAVHETFRINSLRVKRLSPIFLFRWFEWGGFRFYGFEFRLMGVMAVSAEKVGSFATHKVSYPFPMDACLPISVDVSVTFAAEPVTFCKIDEFPVIKPEFIPILSVVAVQTPSHGLGVMELDR
jgi:hypothetical protein